MLTRLKVNGFKNLMDVDIRFGPFTCIAGANGVGKSNLLDAILFLGALADRPLLEAAMTVREDSGKTGDIRNLFYRSSQGMEEKMSFEAEMLVPAQGHDDLGQKAKATITFLRYGIVLGYRHAKAHDIRPGLELLHEELSYITVATAEQNLLFPHSAKWRKSVVKGRRTSPFISTEGTGEARRIKLHGDGGKTGPTTRFIAQTLPRTLLSSVNASESPTALLARREMQSWRLLQLEPSALRAPDSFTAPPRMSSNGAHLPSTLYHLSKGDAETGQQEMTEAQEAQVSARIANRLSQLLDDVREVRIHQDDKRELLTLEVCGKDGILHPARSLSDGTLRFLAIAVLELDPHAYGLLCLEEPENGIHPQRIDAMITLLQDLAVDPQESVDKNNPLQQVIINTHSPAVVAQVPEDSLLFAERVEKRNKRSSSERLIFRPLPGTWRKEIQPQTAIAKGKILAFLNPVTPAEPGSARQESKKGSNRRVIESIHLHQLPLEFSPSEVKK